MSGNEELIVNIERIMPSFNTEEALLQFHVPRSFARLWVIHYHCKSEHFVSSNNFANITDPQFGKIGIIQAKSDHLFI